ncbi:hypothetical protein [Flocculibacter collagenilyticus]|uniref:hypothetical protein n=1 Tax=Flocculibacter collagenilyticus TaxID=2744479 RepID=UPI0018F4BFD4|nr:hypothetical protein [Flocculibacter collagenilyticus]
MDARKSYYLSLMGINQYQRRDIPQPNIQHFAEPLSKPALKLTAACTSNPARNMSQPLLTVNALPISNSFKTDLSSCLLFFSKENVTEQDKTQIEDEFCQHIQSILANTHNHLKPEMKKQLWLSLSKRFEH